MDAIAELSARLGPRGLLTGADVAGHAGDWTGKFTARPMAVARPAATAEVADTLRIAARHGLAVVPAGGRTGLVGGTMTEGGLMLALDRMDRIRALKPGARVLVAEAGCILSRLHEAAADHGLDFPLWFGARGSATVGGALSTNAGGSNVLRHGSARALCLGLEVVLADGRVLDLMGELHKDNSGYALRDLFIGAEGTLGVITAAVLRLVPAPQARATAWVALRALPDALDLLNRLQAASGGAVEALEYLSPAYLARLAAARPDLAAPGPVPPVTVLAELTSPDPSAGPALSAVLEEVLAALHDTGAVLDAAIAASLAQRAAFWARREAAAEVTFARKPFVDTDIALPLDTLADFLDAMPARLAALDPFAEPMAIAHLGDGNIHFTVYPGRADPVLADAIVAAVEDEVTARRGSFSAEHGVGLSKLPSMARRKDPVALAVMRAIKAALDPEGRMNPGKVLPPV
ncbi:MAG TPA: FAD-binding oxidoreductase [Paracoccaceae bacterium]|nr:FAD-binding oxidoreductase [Paracoccaceae bacterium]HMO72398.1 FAD-binding oxidoreductase [Paracoccaceae bacterium]